MRQVIGGKALLSNKCLYFCAFLVGMIDRVKRRMYTDNRNKNLENRLLFPTKKGKLCQKRLESVFKVLKN